MDRNRCGTGSSRCCGGGCGCGCGGCKGEYDEKKMSEIGGGGVELWWF